MKGRNLTLVVCGWVEIMCYMFMLLDKTNTLCGNKIKLIIFSTLFGNKKLIIFSTLCGNKKKLIIFLQTIVLVCIVEFKHNCWFPL